MFAMQRCTSFGKRKFSATDKIRLLLCVFKSNQRLNKLQKSGGKMLGVLVNVATVLIGSTIGLIFKKGISKKYTDAVMTGIGLCTIYIGVSGILKGENVLVAIISMVVGAILGTWIDLDKRINQVGDFLSHKLKKEGEKVSLAEGFVTASLLFCIGAMTIIGSIEAGLKGDNTTLFTKSLLDLFSSMMLSASLGVGVIFASIFVLIFQGGLVLLSGLLEPVLNNAAVAEITCVGSLMILGLGLNLLGITKIKVANYFPALIFAAVFSYLFALLGKFIPAFA